MKVETVAEQLLFSTLRIETNTKVGTGFIIKHRWSEDKEGPFLVTNRHVVDDTTGARLTFTLKSADIETPLIGKTHTVTLSENAWKWTEHPSGQADIAALPLGPVVNHLTANNVNPFVKSLDTAFIPSQDILEDLDAVEEIQFVGYPSGIYDHVHNLPVSRKGTTATPPSVDYNGDPVFLIDASVFPGSSGSPVLLCNHGTHITRTGKPLGQNRLLLLGVLSEVMYRVEDGSLEFRQTPASITPVIRTREMLDLGLVYKSRTIVETIEQVLRDRSEL